MKIRWALAVTPLFAIACQSSATAVQPETSAPASAPVATPASTPANDPQKPGATKSVTTVNEEINPNRRFQLKDLEVRDMKANGHAVKAWLMDDERKRAEGMMFLKPTDFPKDHGMLFVFKSVQPKDAGFWMHDCILGLDIIYADAKGKVITLRHGKPFDDTNLTPGAPYKYVLELQEGVGVGWGIKAGTQLTIPTGLKPKD